MTLSLRLPRAAIQAVISTDDPVDGGGGTHLSPAEIDQNTRKLVHAVVRGDVDAVRCLIPVSDPKANNSEALTKAAQKGRRDIVRLLIPVSDPKADNSAALSRAAATGDHELVRDLIPVSDPKSRRSLALGLAAHMGYPKVVIELVPVSSTSWMFGDEIDELVARNEKNGPDMAMHAAIVNSLFFHVSEHERERAVERLPPHLIDRMPNLVAWRRALELRMALREMPPSAAPASPRRRLSL